MSSPLAIVIKVGGSLLTVPGLGTRLRCWLDTLGTPDVLLVPGGGPTADVIRELDEKHGLGAETAHWLALGALSLNAAVLQGLVPRTQVVLDWRGALSSPAGVVPILDCLLFARDDEEREGHLPHSWEATSDSLAARVAAVYGARQLILLKSVTIPATMRWEEAGGRGYVDPLFAQTCRAAGAGLEVTVINFREVMAGPGRV
jgi:aspartokinase-like uncharacterized kinase